MLWFLVGGAAGWLASRLAAPRWELLVCDSPGGARTLADALDAQGIRNEIRAGAEMAAVFVPEDRLADAMRVHNMFRGRPELL